MNFSRIIEITGQRLRLGKVYSERLSNAQIKEVLEMAIQVMEEALIEEGRIEIQGFAVIEVIRTDVKQSKQFTQFDGKTIQLPQQRIRWLFRPNKILRSKVKKTVK
jgi:nucleoid DNA-binding protein